MKAKPWHAEFVESLEDASDVDRQRRAWLEHAIPNFPPPNELICQLFDDSGIDDLLAEGRVFSETTDAVLVRLSTLAGDLRTTEPPELLLRSRQWIEFAREAARALALVRGDLGELVKESLPE